MPNTLLTHFRAVDTHDTAAVEAGINSYYHDAAVDIIPNKRCHVVFNRLDLGRIALGVSGVEPGVFIRPEPTASNFVLMLPVQGDIGFSLARNSFAASPERTVALLDFTRPLSVSQPKDCRHCTIRFTRKGLEDLLASQLGQPLHLPLSFDTACLDLTQLGPMRLARTVRLVLTAFEQDPGLAQMPLLAAQYEELLLCAMLTCLPHNLSRASAIREPSAPPKTVRLAEAYLDAHLDTPLRMEALVRATGVSFRSIQLAFKKYRGYSPSCFLRNRRLDKARDLLRRACPATTVLSVALACGFSSQSKFSRLYKERFNETPSVTLHR